MARFSAEPASGAPASGAPASAEPASAEPAKVAIAPAREPSTPGQTGLDPAPHLLIVDDDARLRSALRRYLLRNFFLVTEAADAEEARRTLAVFAVDLIVLDVMMPGQSGFEFLTDLRRGGNYPGHVPVLMLTAMIEADARIAGLERGADDYLAKPFEPRELVLRIRNILNRAQGPAQSEGEKVRSGLSTLPPGVLRLGRCQYDIAREELSCGGERIHLTTGETGLLTALARNAGRPVARDALNALGPYAGGERTVDVQITRLRRKIEPGAKFPRYLQTVRGVGYVLKPD